MHDHGDVRARGGAHRSEARLINARRSPPAAWEAWFLIGIFHEGPIRWCKVQLFSGGRRPGWHSLAAIEGMDGAGERLIVIGRDDGITIDRRPVERVDADTRGWDVRAADVTWRGDLENNTLASDVLSATTRARDVLWWARIPRVFSYFSAFGETALQLGSEQLRGHALLEHARGSDVPFDPTRFAPSRWHWDVLAFDDGSTCAGLSIAAGPIALPLRSGGRTPGKAFSTGPGLRVDVDAWSERGGRKVPQRWRARMGDVEYVAMASTDVAPVVPRGGFLGFTFEGRASGRPVAGQGFCEYAAWVIASLADIAAALARPVAGQRGIRHRLPAVEWARGQTIPGTRRCARAARGGAAAPSVGCTAPIVIGARYRLVAGGADRPAEVGAEHAARSGALGRQHGARVRHGGVGRYIGQGRVRADGIRGVEMRVGARRVHGALRGRIDDGRRGTLAGRAGDE